MKKLRIGILDLVTRAPSPGLYGRLMNPNLASIMPQAIGVWCEELGHDVTLVCYTGSEDLLRDLPADMDILFIGAFTQAAQLAYAISHMFRQRGTITILGGPHAPVNRRGVNQGDGARGGGQPAAASEAGHDAARIGSKGLRPSIRIDDRTAEVTRKLNPSAAVTMIVHPLNEDCERATLRRR